MSKRIYVGNVPGSVTQRELTKNFSKFGSVESVNLERGSAVVVMSSGGDTAIKALDQTEMGGRRLRVGLVAPRRD